MVVTSDLRLEISVESCVFHIEICTVCFPFFGGKYGFCTTFHRKSACFPVESWVLLFGVEFPHPWSLVDALRARGGDTFPPSLFVFRLGLGGAVLPLVLDLGGCVLSCVVCVYVDPHAPDGVNRHGSG